ncbi:hypothetical protein NKJ26_19880 [Mesorhizobium sp. M0152]|uniref:hypothetical protein n=1 Tax=Mesorhizobium sp. M0152 TaxID=2956898 RepID=UPI0033394CD9
MIKPSAIPHAVSLTDHSRELFRLKVENAAVGPEAVGPPVVQGRTIADRLTSKSAALAGIIPLLMASFIIAVSFGSEVEHCWFRERNLVVSRGNAHGNLHP